MSNYIDKNTAIKLWQKNNIGNAEFHFSCGGDSFNDYHFEIFDKDNNGIQVDEALTDYLTEDIFNRVDFYEASDGHYMGEDGIVTIELDDDDFSYSKEAESEFEEERTQSGSIKLTDKEVEVMQRLVSCVVSSFIFAMTYYLVLYNILNYLITLLKVILLFARMSL